MLYLYSGIDLKGSVSNMAISSQLLKGLMDGVILKIISKEQTYGYEIYIKLQEVGFKDFAEGSLYPLLLRLERKELISGVKKKSLIGPCRKYYTLTQAGVEEMDLFKLTWDKIADAVQGVWKE